MGRTDKAIYGKLITFGQEYNLNGGTVTGDKKDQEFFVYDVVGDAEVTATGSVKELLSKINASLVVEEKQDNGIIKVDYAGFVESYSPTWGALIENTENELFKGAILVVRHPRSGVVNTLVRKSPMRVNEIMKNSTTDYTMMKNLLKNALDSEDPNLGFFVEQVDFCLNPYGAGIDSGLKRDIRLISNARNASGVEIIDLVSDNSKNACAK